MSYSWKLSRRKKRKRRVRAVALNEKTKVRN